MKPSSFKIGLDSRTHRIVHIDEVDDGFPHAVCPDCQGALVAANLRRDARKNATYFRHAADTECTGETLIHRWAKQVIAEQMKVSVPTWSSVQIRTDFTGYAHTRSHRVPERIAGVTNCQIEQEVVFEREHRRPDLIIDTQDGRHLCIEIYVHNAVDHLREQFYERAGLSCFEIDLSDTPLVAMSSSQLFSDYVVKDAPRRWVSCGLYADVIRAMEQAVIKDALSIPPTESSLRRAAQNAIVCRDFDDCVEIALPSLAGGQSSTGCDTREILFGVASRNESFPFGRAERVADVLCLTLQSNGPLYVEFSFRENEDPAAAWFYRDIGLKALWISLANIPSHATSSSDAFSQYIRLEAPRRWLNPLGSRRGY